MSRRRVSRSNTTVTCVCPPAPWAHKEVLFKSSAVAYFRRPSTNTVNRQTDTFHARCVREHNDVCISSRLAFAEALRARFGLRSTRAAVSIVVARRKNRTPVSCGSHGFTANGVEFRYLRFHRILSSAFVQQVITLRASQKLPCNEFYKRSSTLRTHVRVNKYVK